jgi:flagellar motor switch protein FliM
VPGDQVMLALSSGIVSRAKSTDQVVQTVKSEPSAIDRARMTSALFGTDVELVAVLGELHSTVRELLALRAGDVLRLESTPEEPLDARVGDTIVFHGMPAVRRGNLALQVTALSAKQQQA